MWKEALASLVGKGDRQNATPKANQIKAKRKDNRLLELADNGLDSSLETSLS